MCKLVFWISAMVQRSSILDITVFEITPKSLILQYHKEQIELCFIFRAKKTASNILGAKKTENVQKLRLFWWFWNNVGRHCFFYVFWSPNCFWFVRKTRWEKLKTKPNLVWTKLTFLLTWIFHVFSVFLWNGNSTSEFGWLVPLPSFFLVVHGHFALFSCQWVGV